jgi:uncharacterized protein
MEFEWDDSKSAQCVSERGFAFADVVPAFADPCRRVEPDERRDYGEDRYRLYGRIRGRLFVIAYTMRGRAVRIISARKANPREQETYDDQSTSEERRNGGRDPP